jgi:hypothetical protein
VRPRPMRNPIIESTAAFSATARRPENSFFGWPHHKHDALATVAGLPQAEQTFTRLMEVFFLGSLSTEPAIGGNVAVKSDRALSSYRGGA